LIVVIISLFPQQNILSGAKSMQSGNVETAKPKRSFLRGLLVVLAGLWLALCLSATSVGIGYLLGHSTGTESSDVFAPFYQAWDIIHTRFVDQPVDDTKLIQGAINGMMQSLDEENSTYMDPETYQNASDTLAGYEGIGATVDVTGEYLKIITPFPGSPAEKAGLKTGDEIVKVDGVDMTGKNPSDARGLLLGPAGSHVLLTVRRPGEAASGPRSNPPSWKAGCLTAESRISTWGYSLNPRTSSWRTP
jgi:membrane-associated protease RseP (regulator of RpoE activity)